MFAWQGLSLPQMGRPSYIVLGWVQIQNRQASSPTSTRRCAGSHFFHLRSVDFSSAFLFPRSAQKIEVPLYQNRVSQSWGFFPLLMLPSSAGNFHFFWLFPDFCGRAEFTVLLKFYSFQIWILPQVVEVLTFQVGPMGQRPGNPPYQTSSWVVSLPQGAISTECGWSPWNYYKSLCYLAFHSARIFLFQPGSLPNLQM